MTKLHIRYITLSDKNIEKLYQLSVKLKHQNKQKNFDAQGDDEIKYCLANR